jgi:AcrR family transcriptional regulator
MAGDDTLAPDSVTEGSGRRVTTSNAAGTTPDRILDAALTLVSQQGTGRLSMSAVSAAADVSRPTIYRHFSSKGELLLAMARHEQQRSHERLVEAIEAATRPRDRLDAALRHLVAALDEYPTRGLVEIEPAFVVQRLERALPALVASLVEVLGPSLERAPAVRRGLVSPAEAAEGVLRLLFSDYLVPHGDRAVLLRLLRSSVGLGGRS